LSGMRLKLLGVATGSGSAVYPSRELIDSSLP